jgi:hypothetical protein
MFWIFRAHNKIDTLDRISLENLPRLISLNLNNNKLAFLEDNTFPYSNHLRILLV